MSRLLTAFVTAALTAAVGIPIVVWRLRRKELRERIQEVVAEVRSLKKASVTYWTKTNVSDEERAALALVVKGMLRHIGIEVSRLERWYRAFRFGPSAPIIELRQAVTRSPFEERWFKVDAARADEVSRCADNLIDSLRDAQKWL